MKRFVEKPLLLGIVLSIPTLVVASLTGANEDGMLLIAVALVVLVFEVQRIRESRIRSPHRTRLER
jgi:hypothetical protein